MAVLVRARARLRAPYRRAVTPKPGHIPPPSAKQKSAGSRGRSEPLSAAECEQYRHAVPCCMTSGIKNHLDGVVRGSEEETLTIADTSA